MPGIKRLRGIANSLAQHALSGVCPDRCERDPDQRRMGVEAIDVDLLGVDARNGLAAQLETMLVKEGLSTDRIVAGSARFFYRGQCREPCRVVVALTSREGAVVTGEATERI